MSPIKFQLEEMFKLVQSLKISKPCATTAPVVYWCLVFVQLVFLYITTCQAKKWDTAMQFTSAGIEKLHVCPSHTLKAKKAKTIGTTTLW